VNRGNIACNRQASRRLILTEEIYSNSGLSPGTSARTTVSLPKLDSAIMVTISAEDGRRDAIKMALVCPSSLADLAIPSDQ
jgi:hypothetical protein